MLGSVLALAWAVVPAHADTLRVINLSIKQGHFHPQTVQVPAGEKFKLRVTNHGPAVEEFESTDLNREQIVTPGHSIEVYLGPLKPGRYKFFGDFHPDTAKGEIVAEQEKP
ncbi:MAG: hypothetical protein B7Z66_03460 [Chromatiales bacterium 21-64-14]|nr:MAG: hypothetical protein B7Z66_03460 [Chromatiales bacterium 21-64-14]